MQVDIAIMTIRDDEFEAVFDRLEACPSEVLDGSSGRTYTIFSVLTRANKVCIVALARCPEQGNDFSQQVASDIIRDLDPQLLLVVGIAGGIPHNEFTLGDVIISARIHNFNVNAVNQNDITTFDARGGIHPRVSNIVASLPMYRNWLAGWNEEQSIGMVRPSIDPLQAKDNIYAEAEWHNNIFKSLNTHFGTAANSARLPLFKTGGVASSNSLLKDTEIPTLWLKTVRSMLAVEMESAGVLQAAQQLNVQYPVMAIRGISDIIGFKRDERWTSYACQTAGAFTCAFIKAGIVKPRDTNASTPASSPTQQPGVDAPSATSARGGNESAPLDVFISYSAKDERFKDELETHLAMLRRNKIILPHYSEATAQSAQVLGQASKKKIGNLIDGSQIILLLITPNFLNSDYHYEEMERAMKRHDAGTARVIPIIVRPANIKDTPFKDLLVLPRNEQPIDTWGNRDAIWAKIAEDIQEVCKSLRGG